MNLADTIVAIQWLSRKIYELSCSLGAQNKLVFSCDLEVFFMCIYERLKHVIQERQ